MSMMTSMRTCGSRCATSKLSVHPIMSPLAMVSVVRYGPVEEMSVCDNLGEHLIGNIYIRFRSEDDADKAVADLNNRWFNGSHHGDVSSVVYACVDDRCCADRRAVACDGLPRGPLPVLTRVCA